MPDDNRLVRDLKEAAGNGSLLAQFDLANMYLVGVRGLPRDEKVAIQLLKGAARRGGAVAEEVHHQLRPRCRQIAVNDNPVEAVIDKDQEVAEQLGEQIHGSPLDTRQGSKGDPASTGQTDGGGEELSPRR